MLDSKSFDSRSMSCGFIQLTPFSNDLLLIHTLTLFYDVCAIEADG